MNIGEILKTMQDPTGIPAPAMIFQFLMILTFMIHIVFVNLTLGTSILSVYGIMSKEPFWNHLSQRLPRVTTVSISMTILFGVAPLLFVQTIYDPFWYTSNNLSQWWVIGFIFILILAYLLTYIIYLRGIEGRTKPFIAFVAVALFIIAGIIMHGINYQMLMPEKWGEWYAGNGKINAYGTNLHAISIPRLFHFLVPSLAVTGIFMMLYSWYLRTRQDINQEYLSFVSKKGAGIAFYFTLLQMLFGIWWLFSIRSELRFYTEPFFIISVVSAIFLLHNLYLARKMPEKFALSSGIIAVITIFFMSLSREVLRMKYTGLYGYSIYDYKVSIDIVSPTLFLLTFLIGIYVTGYLLTMAFKTGKTGGTFVPNIRLERWGNYSVILLILWIAAFFLIGIFR